MPEVPKQTRPAATTRAEKLSVLSALLGPEALAKLREGQSAPAGRAVEVDSDRAAWHRNKLLERLRNQKTAQTQKTETQTSPLSGNSPAPSHAQNFPEPIFNSRTVAGGHDALDKRLVSMADVNTFEQEHPAVVARLMRGFSREERITALKSLPGPVARSILRRLR